MTFRCLPWLLVAGCWALAVARVRAAENGSAWLEGGWSCRRAVRIEEGFYFLSDDLEGFPLQVVIDDPGDPIFEAADENGADVRFTDADGVTVLAHEMESFQSRGKDRRMICWVRMPRIRADGDTVFFLYYGNSGAAPPDDAAAEEVWNDGYAAVWHFTDAEPETIGKSSTGLGHGIARGILESARGVIGRGIRFGENGSLDCGRVPEWTVLWREQAFEVPPEQALRPDDKRFSFTIEAWIRYEEHPERGPRATRNIVGAPRFRLFRHEAWRWQGGIGNAGSGHAVYARDAYPAGEWRHLALRFDARRGELMLFIDGARAAAGAARAEEAHFGSDPVPLIRSFLIGADRLGTLDEVRFSVVARSDDGLRLSYRNQKSPKSRIHFETEEKNFRGEGKP